LALVVQPEFLRHAARMAQHDAIDFAARQAFARALADFFYADAVFSLFTG